MGSAAQIWPGPECLTSGPTVGDLLDLSAMAYGQPTEAERRTRGIALAHAKAKARMERFRAWLGRVDGIARGVARRHADKALSPEHAAEHAAADGFHWPFVATGWGDELRRDAVRPEWAALAFDLVRSPDWASLPWQQGPKEVGP